MPAKKKNEKPGKNDKPGGGKDKDTSGDVSSGTKVKGASSIQVRHILCEKHSKKEEALSKIREGKSFDDVAREFSEDKARQGGSLGWKTKGSLEPAFEKVAFELEASQCGKPKIAEAKTGHGYHIIMVEGRK